MSLTRHECRSDVPPRCSTSSTPTGYRCSTWCGLGAVTPRVGHRQRGKELDLSTFRCRTRATDPVFIRSACVRTRPNAPIPLTIDTVIRDREGAARIHSARYAAHAVSRSGGAMVRRAYRQRSLVEVLLPDGDKL